MADTLPANLRDSLASALADADRRGLPGLKPLLEGLARSTADLRAAEWNESVAGRLPGDPAGR